MQRKLIKYDVFEKLQENSLASAQYELMEATDSLAYALDYGLLNFHNFDANHVIYETSQGSYVRANYKLDKEKSITFDNIEEIVIDEETHNQARRNAIRTMLDSILEDNAPKADTLFDEVMNMVRESHKRESVKANQERVNEATSVFARRDPRKGGEMYVRSGRPKKQRISPGTRRRAAKEAWRTRKRNDPDQHKLKASRKRGKKIASAAAKKSGRAPKMVQEWAGLVNNVFGYIDFVENSAAMLDAAIKTNDKGQVTAIRVPTTKARNEGKILSYGLKTLKTDVKVLRETARRLPENRAFCEMIADLKRHNNLADNDSLEESLGAIVTKYPSVLYLTQDELASVLGQSLSNIGATNYDDRICTFMSEGILRVAHEAYADRVNRITQLANTQISTDSEDPYASFQEIVAGFYPSLDEATALEMRVFEDLYNAAIDVRRLALEIDDGELRSEAQGYAAELESILEGNNVPSLEVAATVAEWLESIILETNLESQTWEVTRKPHETITGDHPDMWKKAKHPYAPASDFTGDWGSELPQIGQDDHNYKSGRHSAETQGRSWGNKGGSEVWPSLTNPYVPKPFGDWTMKGERGVDKDWENGIDMWQSGDTWPALQNPYVPKSVKVHVKSDNRVDTDTNP